MAALSMTTEPFPTTEFSTTIASFTTTEAVPTTPTEETTAVTETSTEWVTESFQEMMSELVHSSIRAAFETSNKTVNFENLAFMCAILIVNAGILTLYFIQRFRSRAYVLSPAGLFVLNLLVADVLYAILFVIINEETGIVNFLLSQDLSVSGDLFTLIIVAENYAVRMGSNIAVFNVAVDRCIAISDPIHYNLRVTIKKSLILIAVGWAFTILSATSALLGYPCSLDYEGDPLRWLGCRFESLEFFFVYIRPVLHLSVFLGILLLQCRVYVCLRRHEKGSINQSGRPYSRKSAKTLFWVIIAFVLCWLPLELIYIYYDNAAEEAPRLLYAASFLATGSLFVNPIIFSCKTENIRKPISDCCSDILKIVPRKTKLITTKDDPVSNVTATTGLS